MAKSNILHVIIIITFAFTASASYAVVSCEDMYQIALSIAQSRDKGVPLETYEDHFALAFSADKDEAISPETV